MATAPVLKEIKTLDAQGHVLCHDITQIIPGVIKDARYRRGHVVTCDDISVLLSMGKESLYVWESLEGFLHEDEAAGRLMSLCGGAHMGQSVVKEGKIEITADIDGLFCVDVNRLNAVNSLGDIVIATRHGNTAAAAGDVLAAGRVIPLIISEKHLGKALEIIGNKPLLRLVPFAMKTAAVIVTGKEVYEGRIDDGFTPVLADKLKKYNLEIVYRKICDDNCADIQAAIHDALKEGPDMILCTGGMSVDPDDRTHAAIQGICPDIVTYGAPVLPGSMLMLGYFEKTIPVLGLPGCVMYQTTIFDLILPRLMAKQPISREDFAAMGHGGLCLKCAKCRYPICPFGR